MENSSSLTTFNLNAFTPAQETEQDKSSFETASSSVSCFSEVVVTQDEADVSRYACVHSCFTSVYPRIVVVLFISASLKRESLSFDLSFSKICILLRLANQIWSFGDGQILISKLIFRKHCFLRSSISLYSNLVGHEEEIVCQFIVYNHFKPVQL